ncbi:hypothetical protein E2C01_009398 [Portunus trituberculatus]|uniref:Uncharacterized protein n=1 Tax=Portunus trituberculatus TaxID=210409 RepID=A0A5B7D4E6_PORTR|nr:hypothetical protein [Portunus trituberculatus]
MPRSSVYVRLQWSTDGAAEEAEATAPQSRDTAQSPTPHTTQKTLQPQHSSQEAPEIKEQGSSGNGSVLHGSCQPAERHKSSHKCSVCPAKSPSSPHPPASPPPVCTTTAASLPGSTLITTSATTTTVTTMTTATPTKHSRHAEASPGTQARVKVKVRDAPRDRLRRNLTERITKTTQGSDGDAGVRRTSRAPHLDTSHSLDSPLWHSREQARTDAEGEPQDGMQDGASKPEGVRIYYKSKARLRPKNPSAKGRRITRSLSASCVSVSTNTDPKDFLELAKLSGTLSSRKDKEAHTSRKKDSSGGDTKTKTPSVKEEVDSSGSQVTDLKGHSDAKARPEVAQKPLVREVREELQEEDEEDENCCKAKRTTEDSEETPDVILEEDVTEKLSDTRCAGDGCDDAGKGYIELPTYSPAQPHTNLQEKLPDHPPPYLGDSSCPSHPILPCGPPYPSFHAHTGPLPLPTPSYFTRVPVEGNPTPTEKEKFIVITPHLTAPPSDPPQKAAPSIERPSPSSSPLRVCPVSLSSSPSLDHSQTFSSFKPSPSRTFHLSSQDDADLSPPPYPTIPSSAFHCASVESSPPKAIHQGVIPRSPSSQITERCHWGDKNSSPYPSNRPPTPAVPRRHGERDMSLDSCPDVVLQTLEAEGAASQNKTLKKTVTFLLPPDHWDSLISLRESSSMWACGHLSAPLRAP